MRRAWLAVGLIACGTEPSPRPKLFGGDREVVLHAPDVLDEGRAYPLVMVLHGYGVNGIIQTGFFQLGDLPETGEALLLAPDGTVDGAGKHFWNADPACCDFDGSGVDDAGYLTSVLEDVIAAWPVDRSSVFVVGQSNGAFMGYRLACERPDLITASALLGGNTALPASACAPSEPTSMLVMHATADTFVGYDGMVVPESQIQVASAGAVEAAARWRGYDGCTGSTAGSSLELERSVVGDDETTVEIATGCPDGIGVELWTHRDVEHIPIFNNTYRDHLWGWLAGHPRS